MCPLTGTPRRRVGKCLYQCCNARTTAPVSRVFQAVISQIVHLIIESIKNPEGFRVFSCLSLWMPKVPNHIPIVQVAGLKDCSLSYRDSTRRSSARGLTRVAVDCRGSQYRVGSWSALFFDVRLPYQALIQSFHFFDEVPPRSMYWQHDRP